MEERRTSLLPLPLAVVSASSTSTTTAAPASSASAPASLFNDFITCRSTADHCDASSECFLASNARMVVMASSALVRSCTFSVRMISRAALSSNSWARVVTRSASWVAASS